MDDGVADAERLRGVAQREVRHRRELRVGDRVGLAPEALALRPGAINLRFDDLRREAGSLFLEGGMAANYVQKFLDHAKLSTTSRYLNIQRDGMHAALKGFEKQRKTQEQKRKRSEERALRGNPWQTKPVSGERPKSGRADKPVQ
jgi:integrase